MRVVLTVAAAGVLLAAAACSARPEAASAVPDATHGTATTASPTADPTPAPPAVAGERQPAASWVDASGLLTPERVPVGDADVVLPFVHEVGDWLDAHLDDLQRGGDGLLATVASPALLAAATGDDLAAVTTALTTPDRPVTAATYRLDAAFAGAGVEWLTATVTVDTTDGRAGATLVFVPGSDGPELVLLGPAAAVDGAPA